MYPIQPGERMKKSTLNFNQLAIWAGMLGPALFVTVFTLEGLLRPGYQPLAVFVSELSLGPRGWIQITNFIVLGALLLAFAWRVGPEFRSGKAARGRILLAIMGFCFLFSGPFVMDPTGTPSLQMSFHGMAHGILGGIVFILMPVTCFVYLRRFWADPRWQSLRGWTLALGTISAVGSLLLTIATKSPDAQNLFKDWLGLIQRTAIVPFMVWLFLFALKLHRLNRHS
jgi:hypothetical protein